MKIDFDPAKCAATLRHRGLDFVDSPKVFAGAVLEFEDERFGYDEPRTISVGLLENRVVVIVWTDRGDSRRIISMRDATKGESDEYFEAVG